MLNAMREGAKSGILRFIFFGLMALATFGLVLTDAGGFFGSGFGRQTVAKIGEIELTLPVFNNIYSREISRSNLPPEMARAYGVPQMVLGREINRLSLLQAAHESQIRVGDKVVAQSIKAQLDQVGLEGNDEENLDYVLRQMNMSEAQLTRGTREDIASSLIQTTTLNTGKTMPMAVNALYKYNKEKRVAEIVIISPSDITDIPPITDEAVANFYQQNQAAFTIPEKRSVKILHVTSQALGRDIAISDDMVADFYENNRSEYRQDDQYSFSQTLYETQEDANNKVEGQEMATDWYTLSNLPSEIALALKELKTGETIGPIETTLGFHVITLNDIKKDQYTPLSEVEGSIKQTLRDREMDDQIYRLADDLDNAVAEGLSLSDIAQQYDISLKTIPSLESDSLSVEGLPQNQDDAQEILETVFIIDEQEISPVIELTDGSFVLAQVTEITPEEVKSLADVSTDIKKQLSEQQKSVAVQSKAAQFMSSYNKDEGSIEELARKQNVSFTRTRAIGRIPQGGVAVSTDEANLLFSLTPKNDVSSLRVGKDVKIIRLADIQETQTIPQTGEEITALEEKIALDINNEMQQQFTNAWKEKFGVHINMPLFQKAFLTAPEEN